jgi:hypothetical protein
VGIELTILVYAAFLHDIGLSLTDEERLTLLASPPFDDGLRDWPAIAEATEESRCEEASTGAAGCWQVSPDTYGRAAAVSRPA